MRLIAALAFALIAATASAQTSHFDAVLQAPPLATTDLVFIAPVTLPSSFFSAGWDHIAAVPIGTERLMRLFYRKADGLTVAIIESVTGVVLAQSQVFTMGTGADVLNVTLLTRDNPPLEWSATVVVFAYNRTSGVASRTSLTWNATFR